MGRDAEREALESHLQELWPDLDFGPMAWSNINFKTPDNSCWASFQIVELGTYRLSLGRDFSKRHMGQVQIDLYVPGGNGTAASKRVSDYLEDLYEMLEIRTRDGELITFETPNAHDLTGAQERQDGTNDNWYRRVLEAPYHRDSHVIK